MDSNKNITSESFSALNNAHLDQLERFLKMSHEIYTG